MKTVRRMLAVLLLVVVVLAVGYLFFTGSRLADTQQEALEQRDGDVAVLLCNGDDGRAHADDAAGSARDVVIFK